jgi:sugar phosphate isomerase/epimerase
MSLDRRRFLGAALAAGTMAGARTAVAIEPIRRDGKSRMRLSLAAYSFNRYLSLKAKTKPSMTLDDFVTFAADQPIDAIEPTAYYFADTSTKYLAALKSRCTRLGLDISGTAVGNDFCHTDAAKLKSELQSVKEWIERASLLGAKTLRIFAGSLKKGDTEDAARSRCIATIEEACDHAAKYGVILALENHGGIVSTADQMLSLVQGVKHEAFGVNLDTGNFHTPDPYGDLAIVAPYAVTVQLKTEIQAKGRAKEDADLARLIAILRKVSYSGYVALEYEAAEDPRVAVPGALGALRKILG